MESGFSRNPGKRCRVIGISLPQEHSVNTLAFCGSRYLAKGTLLPFWGLVLGMGHPVEAGLGLRIRPLHLPGALAYQKNNRLQGCIPRARLAGILRAMNDRS